MKQQPGDTLADDLERWLDETVEHLAQRIEGSALAPPTAPLTQAEKLRYFANQFFTPDGQPNEIGRNAVMQKYGPKGFAQIAKELAKKHGQLHEDTTGEPLPEPNQRTAVHSGGDWIAALHAQQGGLNAVA